MKFFFCVILCFSILLISSCQEEVKPILNDSMVEDEIPSQESWDSKIMITNDGMLKALIYADHIRMYDERKETLLRGVEIHFFDEEGVKVSELTSKRGRVDDSTQDMFAIDSVVAVNDDGTVLETDELMWASKTKKITTDKFVTITTSEERIEGYGFVSDQGLDQYTIYNITYSTRLNNK